MIKNHLNPVTSKTKKLHYLLHLLSSHWKLKALSWLLTYSGG